ncbi:hypothetical protein D3C72_1156360 [compost metagenome]
MYTDRNGGVRGQIQHVAHPQQRFSTALIEDSARVNLARHGKGDTGRDVGLDQAGDHIHRRTLGCQHQVDTRRTRFLRQTSNQLLNLFTNRHDQVSELVDHHHDVRLFLQNRRRDVHAVGRFPERIRDWTSHRLGLIDTFVVTCQVTHAERRHQLVATLHLGDAPTQGIGGVFHVGNHVRQQVWNTFIDRQLQHFRINHDKAHFFRRGLIQNAQDHGIDPNRFTGAGGPRHQQVWHFRQVGHHRLAGDVFTQNDRQRRWIIAECRAIQHFSEIDRLTFNVRQFQADIGLAGDHFNHTHRGS